MEEFMDKETWIKSRTDNPDRLGKEIWSAMYDRLIKNGEGEMPQGTPKNFITQMTQEYITKNGLSCNLDNPVELETAKLLMQIVRDGKDFQSLEIAQKTLDVAAKKYFKVKNTLAQCSQKGAQPTPAQISKVKSYRGK